MGNAGTVGRERASALQLEPVRQLHQQLFAVAQRERILELLVRAVAAEDIFLVERPAAHVGDGATVIADETGKLIGLTSPPVGEYINETTFITSAEALRRG